MDLAVSDSNGRHVSVIVRPKSDLGVAPPASTDVMIKALARSPWATALMMHYRTSAPTALADRYEQSITANSSSAVNQQQQQLLPPPPPPPPPPPQATQTFGALLKAAMRNRNANNNSVNGSSSFAASGSAATSPQQPQTPNAVPNRMSYPREFKLLVIGYYFNNGQNKYRTCKEFQITKSMLNGWLQKVDKIQQSRPGSLKSGRSGRKPQFPQVESELYNVYLAYLAQGKKVGNRWLRDTAKCIAQRRCSTDELNGMCQFSERWLCNFKKRFGINLTKDWNDKPSNIDDSTSTDNAKADPLTPDHQPDTKSNDTNPTTTKSQESPDTTVDVESASNSPIQDQKLVLSSPRVSGSPHGGLTLSSPAPARVRSNHSSAAYEPGKRGRKVQFPQVERVLFKKLRDKQIDGARVSNRWLQDEARRLAIELCPQLFTDTFKSARCMFSEHWLHNFKKRYGITLKQPNSRAEESSPSDCADMPLNLTVTEPVSSSDDVQQHPDIKNEERPQTDDGEASKHRKPSTNAHVMDDLPTMVPLPMICKTIAPPPINFAEWYSKITTMIGHRSEAGEDNAAVRMQSHMSV